MTTAVPPVVGHLGEDFLAQVYGRTYRHFPGEPHRYAYSPRLERPERTAHSPPP